MSHNSTGLPRSRKAVGQAVAGERAGRPVDIAAAFGGSRRPKKGSQWT
jgi:hypothetical protein